MLFLPVALDSIWVTDYVVSPLSGDFQPDCQSFVASAIKVRSVDVVHGTIKVGLHVKVAAADATSPEDSRSAD